MKTYPKIAALIFLFRAAISFGGEEPCGAYFAQLVESMPVPFVRAQKPESLQQVKQPAGKRRWFFSGWHKKGTPVSRPAPNRRFSLAQQKNPALETDRDRALVEIDRIFYNSIEAYPAEIQTELKRMWEKEKNVLPLIGMLSTEQIYANWLLEYSPKEGIVWFVNYSPELKETPLLFKLSMLHEISGHVGQGMTGVRQHGIDRFVLQVSAGRDFETFTEMSAALLENAAISRIPFEVFEYDISRSSLPLETKERILGDYFYRWKLPPQQAASLAGRGYRSIPNQAEHRLFMTKTEGSASPP